MAKEFAMGLGEGASGILEPNGSLAEGLSYLALMHLTYLTGRLVLHLGRTPLSYHLSENRLSLSKDEQGL